MLKKKDSIKIRAQKQSVREWSKLARDHKVPKEIIQRVREKMKGGCDGWEGRQTKTN